MNLHQYEPVICRKPIINLSVFYQGKGMALLPDFYPDDRKI
jgi:hypothetical protein